MVTSSLLGLDQVVSSYGSGRSRRQILHGVNLAVAEGESVGLIGETGSGKSTLARVVLGLVPVDSGRVSFRGRDLSGLKARTWRDFRRAGQIQYVFQDPLQSFDPDLTVGDSIGEGLRLTGTSRAEIEQRLADVLERVGLDHEFSDRLPAQLSGGQRQRAAIARALIRNPELLILDEPVSALDAAIRIRILELLKEIRATLGVAQIFISHDLGSVAGLTDRTAVLYRGHIVEEGPTSEVLSEPQHPYTRLLVASAPSLGGGAGIDRAERNELKQRVLEVTAP